MRTLIYYFSAVLMVFTMGCNSRATDEKISFDDVNEPLPEIGIYEHLDTYLPKDLVFYNEKNEKVVLNEWITKPTVLSFVYFKCPGLCSPLLDGLVEVVGKTKDQLGKDYQVATISFDTTDAPEAAQRKKDNFTGKIKLGDLSENWLYLTTDSATIQKITGAVGFKFKQEGKDFIHAAALVVVSPDGKITRYLHGTQFLPFDLKMAVTEASNGKSSPTINKVLQFCFSYDAEGKRYVLNVTQVSASIIIFFALMLFGFLAWSRKPLRERQA